jgi:LmbE family N-acetylglucosaminyl deacetylase
MSAARRRTIIVLFAVVALFCSVFTVTGPAHAAISCAQNLSLNLPAHEDDDLLFMNPDIQKDIDTGRCVLTTFMTSGDAGRDESYWGERERGSHAAYAHMAGLPDEWTRRTVTVNGHPLAYDELVGRPDVALIFLRLPDGGRGTGFPSSGNESLQQLWSGTIPTIHALDGTTSYTKESLTKTLTDLMHTYQPDVIRTLDYAGKYGDGDHSDHHSAGYFGLAAHKAYFSTPHQLYSLMAYPSANQAVNLSVEDSARKLATFLVYAVHDDYVCQTEAACLAGNYAPWFSRRYSTGSETGGRQNAALIGTLTASSQNTSTNQQVTKAADDTVAGSPADATKEWATIGGKGGSWIHMTWPTQHTIDTVVLYDRPNSNDQVTSGTIYFSDGAPVSVGELPNNGSALVVKFAPHRVSSLRFTVNTVSSTTANVGLAELQAYTANVATQAFLSVSSENAASQQTGLKATDGYASGTPAAPTREWATIGGKAGSWLRLSWASPRTFTRVVLYDRPNTNDQITGAELTFDNGDPVTVPALTNNGAALVVTFPAHTASTLTLTVKTVSATTQNVGLAEIQVEP